MVVLKDELGGFPAESWDLAEGGSTATREFKVPWSLRYDALTEIVESPIYPYIGSGLRAKTVSIMPYDGIRTAELIPGTGLANYSTARITVEYGTNAPETDDLISEVFEPTAEFITLDPIDFEWSDMTALKDGEAPGKLLRGLDYVLTIHSTLVIPSAILTLPGNVNDVDITATTLGLTFEAETLLYQPPKVDRTISINGSPAWKLVHRFSHRGTGWNKFWRADTQEFDTLITKSGGLPYKNYPLGDFSPLFP